MSSDRGRTVYLDRDLYDELAEAAEDRGVSATWLARRLVEDGISRLVPANQMLIRKGGQ